MPSPDSGQLSREQLPCTQSISLKSAAHFFLEKPFISFHPRGQGARKPSHPRSEALLNSANRHDPCCPRHCRWERPLGLES